jgi:UDP-N-acetylmuramate dehydrogenase
MNIDRLEQILSVGQIEQNVVLAPYTSFKIGGPADVMVHPHNVEQLQAVLAYCQEENIPWFFLGKGSNLLVNDEGFRGVVILPEGEFARVETSACEITAGCNVSLARIAREALDRELTGFEFAAGIPGTLGGAVYMNAGAYGGEMCQVLKRITYLDDAGVHTIGVEEAQLSYRSSRFMQEGGIVLEAVIALQPSHREEIMAKMQELAVQRKTKQPLEYPSAGSMFKRPVGYFAGKLIQDADLRGFRVGDAQVSEKHCGFVVNVGNATAAEVKELVYQVSQRVFEAFGVRIWPEVRYLAPNGLKPLLELEE